MLSSRTSFRSLLVIAAVAVISAMTFAVDTVTATVGSMRAWVVDQIFTAARLAPTKAGEVAKQPEQALRVAKAYVARMVRRERPHIESNFRLCSST